MNSLEILNISLGLTLPNFKNLKSLYENRFSAIKYYNELIRYPHRYISLEYKLPSLDELILKYYNKSIKINDKVIKYGKLNSSNIIIFGRIEIPFIKDEIEHYYPSYNKNEENVMFLMHEDLILFSD